LQLDSEEDLPWKGILSSFSPTSQPPFSAPKGIRYLLLQGPDTEQDAQRKGLGSLAVKAASTNVSPFLVPKRLSRERCSAWLKHEESSATSCCSRWVCPKGRVLAEAQAGAGASLPTAGWSPQKPGGAAASGWPQHLRIEALMENIKSYFQKSLHFRIFQNRQAGD